jgi:SAM-dependent methyltransferase
MDEALELTSRVEATHFWFRGFRGFVSPMIAEIAGPRRDLQILDCGCGTGYNLATLLRPYGHAFGFDLTPAGLAYARAAGFPLARANMSAIPFQSAHFDLVTSFDVMQYVDDDYAAVKEMARVLKPGGGLVVTASAMEMLRGGHAGTWPEVRRYTTGRMRSMVEAAGLKVRRLTYLFASLFPMMVAVRAVDRVGGAGGAGEAGRDDWEMRIPAAPINSALTWMLGTEAALSRRIAMPVGSSVLVVAAKN